jgi:hypothetical protein
MTQFPLASNSDWELTNDEQDIRGWEVRDGDNKRLGKVTQMLMNTETEMVDIIRLDTGREIAAADVHIGKDVVYCDVKDVSKLLAVVSVVKMHDGYWRITRRVILHDPAFTGYERAFRSHYNNNFATTGWVYEFYLPGYRFGYTLASEAANASKTYEQVEPHAKADFISRHGDIEYSGHREAIRYGYEYHREKLLSGGL